MTLILVFLRLWPGIFGREGSVLFMAGKFATSAHLIQPNEQLYNDFRQKRNAREQVHGFQPLTRSPSVGNLL